MIDAADYNTWRDNVVGALAVATTVPEPITLKLAAGPVLLVFLLLLASVRQAESLRSRRLAANAWTRYDSNGLLEP